MDIAGFLGFLSKAFFFGSPAPKPLQESEMLEQRLRQQLRHYQAQKAAKEKQYFLEESTDAES